MTQRLACRLIAAAVLAGMAGPVAAQAPRSAIPWLSESLEGAATPVALPAAPPPSDADPTIDAPAGGPTPAKPDLHPGLGVEDISVTPLDAVSLDAVGLLPPAATGLRRDLWGPTPAADVRAAILAHPVGGVPEARALFQRILLAQADPPESADAQAGVLLARLDRLLEMGALEQADALIQQSGADQPELFRRWFDIGLLTGRAEQPCEALRQNPSLSPTLPARVFCLARGGDWNAAEITLTLGEEVGSISEEQQPLLARFLDPELFEGEPDPPVPDPLTPLDFLMREAVGLPRPAVPLPLAFLHHDLNEHVPMRIRAEAAERLAAAGTLDPDTLHTAYTAGEPAASGGIWDRAAAIQALDQALDTGSPERIVQALAAADEALSARGLRVAFARIYASNLAELNPGVFASDTRSRIFELVVLGGEGEKAEPFAARQPRDRHVAILALLDADGFDGGTRRPGLSDPMAEAVVSAFSSAAPEGEYAEQLAAKLQEGRQGEAILDALDLLANGYDMAPDTLRSALFILRMAGQDPAARAIAAQTLLGEVSS